MWEWDDVAQTITIANLFATETGRNRFHGEVAKLEKELQLLREQFKRKSDDFNATLEDLANDHRVSEDGRVEALQELESRKFEISDLRLFATETGRNRFHGEVAKLEKELQLLREQFKRKSDDFNATLGDLANDHRVFENGRVEALQELESRKFEISDLRSHLETAEQRSATLQQEYLNIVKDRETNRDSLSFPVDYQPFSSLHAAEVKLASAKELLKSQEKALKRRARHAAEVKLASAKELLKSQEEALKQRDEEQCSLKSKISAFDLEIRGKEVQITCLNNLNDALRKLTARLESGEGRSAELRDDVDRMKRDLAKA
uniref:Myosin tail domain-containing protein n=1 Tax=Ascaris lumbricoides TaxID=6252 RepID=A0A0M3IGR8_ASCLU